MASLHKHNMAARDSMLEDLNQLVNFGVSYNFGSCFTSYDASSEKRFRENVLLYIFTHFHCFPGLTLIFLSVILSVFYLLPISPEVFARDTMLLQ